MNTSTSFESISLRNSLPTKTTAFNVAVVTVPLGILLAVVLIPSDVTTPGALFWTAWALSIGLIGGLAHDLVRRGPLGVLRAQHLLMIAVAVLSYGEALQVFYVVYLDTEIITKTIIAIGLFAMMLALGSSLPPGRLPRAVVELSSREYPPKMIFQFLLLCWSLQMFNYFYASDFSLTTMVRSLFLSRWSSPWSRGALGGWEAFRDFLTNFGYVVPTFTVVLALRRGTWRKPDVIVGILCSLSSLAFIAQSGARRLLVVILGAAMLTWFCSKKRRLRIAYFVVGFAIVVVTVLFSDFILAQRKSGYEEISYSRNDFEGVKIDNNFTMLAETLRIIPADVDYVGWQFPWYIIIRPIPRVFWPNKPVDPGFDLAQHLGARGVSYSITGIGEMYMSFGWIGIILGGLAMGWLAATWSQVLELNRGVIGSALYGLGAMALFLTIRSFLELVLMTYPIVCWFALDFVLWKSRLRKRRVQPRRAESPISGFGAIEDSGLQR